MPIIRAALYMRVSTDKQAKEGDSIPAQKEALERYAKEKGYVIAGEYIDDGVSGTKSDRDELQKLLDDVKQSRIDIVLVTKLDRWFRSIRHYLNTQEILDKHKVPWIAIWEPIYDTSTPQGRLIINQMMSIAQFEAENTSQRIKQVFAYKREKGEVVSGNVPLGFCIKNKHLHPDENADYIRQVFSYYAQTSSLFGTMEHFSHLGIFPRTRGSFKALLQNQKYRGALVDPALFDDVQNKLPKNVPKSQKYTYIFSGLIVCKECGCRMAAQLHHSYKGAKPQKVYICKSHYNERPRMCSNTKKLNQNVLERYLLENIKPLLEMKVDAVRKEESKDNSGRIAYLEKKIKKLKELYINDLITIEEYREDKESALAEISTLSAPRSVDTKPYEDFIKLNIGEQYKAFTDAEKRIFWRALIDRIEFDRDRNISVFFLESYRDSN